MFSLYQIALVPTLKPYRIGPLLHDHRILLQYLTWGQKLSNSGYKANPSSQQSDFQCLILPTTKKYSLLFKLKQHIKKLRIDRNSKGINLPKRIIYIYIYNIYIYITEHVSCNIFEMSFLTNANTWHSKQENGSNSWVWSKPVWNSKYFDKFNPLDLMLPYFWKKLARLYVKLKNPVSFRLSLSFPPNWKLSLCCFKMFIAFNLLGLSTFARIACLPQLWTKTSNLDYPFWATPK